MTAAPAATEAAAPATTSAPATSSATESTSSAAATTAAPTTGAETTTAAGGDGGEQTGDFQPTEGQSLEEMIANRLSERQAEREKAQKTEDDQLAGELNAATEKKPEGDQATENKEGQATTEPTTEFDLDEPEFSTKWLDGLANDKKITFADERTKGQLFKIVREHNEFKGIAEQFGGDIEEAKQAITHASSFTHFDELYEQAATPDGTRTFLEALASRQQQEPILGEDGKPVDVVSALFNNMREMDLQFFEKEFKNKGDDEGLAALDILRERISPNRTPASESELPPHLAKREAALREREQQLARTQQEQKQAVRVQYEQSVASDLDTDIGKIIDPVLNKAAFAEVIKDDCRGKIFDRIEEVLTKNPIYMQQMKRALSKDPTPENRAAARALGMKWFNTVGPQIIRATVKEYQNPVVRAQESRDQRQAAQVAASKVEPKGPSVSTGPQAQLTKEQLLDKTRTELTAKLGRAPNSQELIEAWMAQKQASRAAQGR